MTRMFGYITLVVVFITWVAIGEATKAETSKATDLSGLAITSIPGGLSTEIVFQTNPGYNGESPDAKDVYSSLLTVEEGKSVDISWLTATFGDDLYIRKDGKDEYLAQFAFGSLIKDGDENPKYESFRNEGYFGIRIKSAQAKDAGVYVLGTETEILNIYTLFVYMGPSAAEVQKDENQWCCKAQSNSIPPEYQPGMLYIWKLMFRNGMMKEGDGACLTMNETLVVASCYGSELGSDMSSPESAWQYNHHQMTDNCSYLHLTPDDDESWKTEEQGNGLDLSGGEAAIIVVSTMISVASIIYTVAFLLKMARLA